MMTITRYLKLLLRALLACLWTPAIAGAVAALPADSPLNIPPIIFLLSCVFSTLSGVTTLAMRINKQLNAQPNKPLLRPLIFCLGHMGGSWLAGSLGFFASQSWHLDVWQTFALVLMMSFGGATAIEWAIKKTMPGFPVGALGVTVPAELDSK